MTDEELQTAIDETRRSMRDLKSDIEGPHLRKLLRVQRLRALTPSWSGRDKDSNSYKDVVDEAIRDILS